MNQPKRTDWNEGSTLALAALVFVARSLAATIEVFVHYRQGIRYFGLQVMGPVAIIPVISLLFPRDDAQPLYWFLAAYLLVCFLSRIAGLINDWRGERQHSYYTGRPFLLLLLRRIDENTVKRIVEPLLVLLGGWAVLYLDRLLGIYLIFAGLGLLLSTTLAEAYYQKRMLDLNDAMQEQRDLAARYRDEQQRW